MYAVNCKSAIYFRTCAIAVSGSQSGAIQLAVPARTCAGLWPTIKATPVLVAMLKRIRHRCARNN